MTGSSKTASLRFVLAVGVVNLFADFAYEGARSVTGAFLGVLGANATIVGVTAGAGEAIGYVVRSVSGVIADRTRRYWIEIPVGYAINMLCVLARTGGDFHGAFASLLIPALLTPVLLAVAATQFRARGNLAASTPGKKSTLREGCYWSFVAGGSLMAAGFAKATSFGVYDTFFGAAWFLGSALLGFLYDRSLTALVIFAVATQLASIPLFVASASRSRSDK